MIDDSDADISLILVLTAFDSANSLILDRSNELHANT
jgi:hypothetical protein